MGIAKATIDHLVFAAPDLTAAIAQFTIASGVAPSPGGAHPNWGTRNVLVALGPATYLEIIGPDVDQVDFNGQRPFRIDELTAPALVTWAAKASPIDRVVSRALDLGYDPGPIFPGKRQRPDGTLLEWSLTMPQFDDGGGIIPFLIDWGNSPHPAATAAVGCALTEFTLHHPEAQAAIATLAAIGIHTDVRQNDRAYVEAQIDTPRGSITLGPNGITAN